MAPYFQRFAFFTLPMFFACANRAPEARSAAQVEPNAPTTQRAEASEDAPRSAPVMAKSADAEDKDEHSATIPSECVKQGELCLPPSDFAQRVCEGNYPSVAIVMFEKKAPWTRGYIRVRQVQQFGSPSGRTTVSELTFAEEVLILRHRSSKTGGMSVSGSGGYDVLRWDGSCATLAEDELVTYQPAPPRSAAIVWKYLDAPIQDALLENESIKKARQAHREHCKGVDLGQPTKACERASQRLNDRITVALRQGMELPDPTRIP
jgi:hypothetical protein